LPSKNVTGKLLAVEWSVAGGQIAGHLELGLAGLLDLGRLEGDRRELGDVEEVGRLEVRVALGLAGVDV
jgi:hypothetical protein